MKKGVDVHRVVGEIDQRLIFRQQCLHLRDGQHPGAGQRGIALRTLLNFGVERFQFLLDLRLAAPVGGDGIMVDPVGCGGELRDDPVLGRIPAIRQLLLFAHGFGERGIARGIAGRHAGDGRRGGRGDLALRDIEGRAAEFGELAVIDPRPLAADLQKRRVDDLAQRDIRDVAAGFDMTLARRAPGVVGDHDLGGAADQRIGALPLLHARQQAGTDQQKIGDAGMLIAVGGAVDAHRLAQLALAVVIAAERRIEVGEVAEPRREARVVGTEHRAVGVEGAAV